MSVFRPRLFQGKVAIVTGGASGIGKCIAREMLQLGGSVIVAGRNVDKLKSACEELSAECKDQNTITSIPCNIRKEDEVENLMREATQRFGKLDYLVNNAGGQFPSPASEISAKGWNAVIDTNLTGTWNCCRYAFKYSMEEHGGSIVNIIADMFRGFAGMAHTGAARAGVENLTRSLAVEWAPYGIRINSIAPGVILSSGLDTYAPEMREAIFSSREHIPAKRFGTEEEVSSSTIFMLSPGAAYVTGATLRVDGASSLWRQPGWTVPPHQVGEVYGGPPGGRSKL